MKIFISIASYQDPLLAQTINDAYSNAERKENLIFGICDQSLSELNFNDFIFAKQIRYEHIDPLLAKGPCWARARIQAFYDNEDFYLQIDSHMLFEQGWDTILLKAFEEIQSRSVYHPYFEKPVITGYPRGFEYLEDGSIKKLSDELFVMPTAYRKDSLFMKDAFSRQIGLRTKKKDYCHGFLVAAGCLFSSGSIVKDVPYDDNYYFYGEEISTVLRLFTSGYSMFHMPSLPIFHLYEEKQKEKRPLHWDKEEDKNRAIKWHTLEQKSLERLSMLIQNNISGKFGLGNKRTIEDYTKLSGVDLAKRQVIDFERATTNSFFQDEDWKNPPL